MRYAGNLVRVGQDIEKEFGVPIINKRISVTPISMVAEPSGEKSYVEWAVVLDKAAKELNIDFVGGFSALVQKGITPGDRTLIESIPEALNSTERVCSSVNVGTTKNGINMDAVKKMGPMIKKTAYLTRDTNSFGCAKFVAFHGYGQVFAADQDFEVQIVAFFTGTVPLVQERYFIAVLINGRNDGRIA